MYRFYPYLLLFAACVLVQVFLFDNLAVSIYLDPLVYVAFILLLPLDAPSVAVLGAGLAMGVTMDFAMGAAGVNTIATLFAAFLQPVLVGLLYGRDNAREGGTPSPERMGLRVFLRYVAILVLIHHALFFLLEALSWTHLLHTLVRIFVSSAATIVVVWFAMRLFTAKLPVRI